MYQYRSWVFKNDIHDDFDFDYDATEEFKIKRIKSNDQLRYVI